MQPQVGNQWASALAQLAGACREEAPVQALARLAGERHEERVARFNPHPSGVIRFGCGAHAVFTILCEDPRKVFLRQQLIERTGMSRKAVDWAIHTLRSVGAVEVIDLPADLRRRRVFTAGRCGREEMAGRVMSGATAPRLGFRKGAADPQVTEWHLSRLTLPQRVANFMNH